MQTASTTGRKSRTTDEATLQENPDDGQCVVCTAPADGVDAAREGNPPVCSNCAKIRADGGLTDCSSCPYPLTPEYSVEHDGEFYHLECTPDAALEDRDGEIVTDGGVPEHVDDELAEAIAAIPDADVESIAQYDDGSGHFVIESAPDDQDVDEIDAALEEAGYERNGHLPVPGMTQQNFRPVEENGGESA
jgi:hypothetical protein